MTQRETDVDLLRSLSVIEGAVIGKGDSTLSDVVSDELAWIVSVLVARLKEKE